MRIKFRRCIRSGCQAETCCEEADNNNETDDDNNKEGLSAEEQSQVKGKIDSKGLGAKVKLINGTDEIGMCLVSGWLAFHADELYAAWNKAVRNEPFDRIPPLQ